MWAHNRDDVWISFSPSAAPPYYSADESILRCAADPMKCSEYVVGFCSLNQVDP
jgi:hypothetical protein